MKSLKWIRMMAGGALALVILLVLAACEHQVARAVPDNPNIITLTQTNFREQVLQSTQPVLVDFWAVWCGPCKILAPTINEVAAEYAGRVKVGKVDVDQHESLVQEYAVEGFPTVLVFKDGKVVDRFLGVVEKREIVEKVNKLLASAAPSSGTPAK